MEIRNKPSGNLDSEQNRILQEARDIFFKCDYEQALQQYVRAFWMSILRGDSGFEKQVESSVIHNIASCLHHLDELNEAQEWYARAIASFRSIKSGWFDGDVNERRIRFSEEKMQRAAQGLLPTEEFLDSNGNKALPSNATTPAPTVTRNEEGFGVANAAAFNAW